MFLAPSIAIMQRSTGIVLHLFYPISFIDFDQIVFVTRFLPSNDRLRVYDFTWLETACKMESRVQLYDARGTEKHHCGMDKSMEWFLPVDRRRVRSKAEGLGASTRSALITVGQKLIPYRKRSEYKTSLLAPSSSSVRIAKDWKDRRVNDGEIRALEVRREDDQSCQSL